MLQKLKTASTNWLMKGVLVLVSLTFVLWGTSSIWNLFIAEDVLLTVNGYDISSAFFEQAVYSYREDLVRGTTSSQISQLQRYQETELREEVLSSIINTTLMRQAAAEDDIRLSDRQIDQIIVSQPAFQVDGRFDASSYNEFLSRSRTNSAYYKENIDNNYKVNTYESSIAKSAFFVERELDLYADLRYQEFNYNYLALEPADFVRAEPVSEETLRLFYEDNIDDYYLPEQFSISYYILDEDSVLDEVIVTDEEISQVYFGEYGYLLAEGNITLRQIFFSDDAGIRLDLEDTAAALREQIETEEDFIALVSERSEDEQTVANGGLLETSTIEDLPTEFVDEIISSAPTQKLVGPIRTTLGVHLLWVVARDEVDVPPLAEVRDDLEFELSYSKVEDVLLEKAENFSYEILNTNDLQNAAATLNITGGAEAVFEIGDGFAEQFGAVLLDEVLTMAPGEVTDVLFLDDGTYMAFSLDARREVQLRAFSEIITELEYDYQLSLATLRVQELAEEIVAVLTSGSGSYQDALQLLPAELSLDYDWEEVRGLSRQAAEDAPQPGAELAFSLAARVFPYGGTRQDDEGRILAVVVDSVSNKNYAELPLEARYELRDEYLEQSRLAMQDLVLSSLRERADITVNEELAGIR